MQNKKELMAFKPTNLHIPSKGKKINITKPHFPSSTTQAERLGPTFKEPLHKRWVICYN